MRLIDLDKVKWENGFYDMHTGEQFAPMMFNTPEAIEWAIAEAEVDAIPIEWLLNHLEVGNTEQNNTIYDLINLWEKENEID